ncbi:MAG TPA: hypothetical protein VLG46_06065, partial [Anaerolineae bacterium]|nr:hypothetical protein [Anaerolineae bacterium]
GLMILLFWRDRLFFDPPLFCLTPPPAEATVVCAIRVGPGDGGPGLGLDGRTYAVNPLECPHWVGVGSPKLKMLLRIREGEKVVEEKTIGVAIIDEDRVVVTGLP